jgi:putative photosynthetic complex assembly protein
MLQGINKPALLAAAAIFAVLSLVVSMNLIGTQTVDLSARRTAVITRPLIFRDAPGGAIAVYDQGASEPFSVLPREGNTFMASALRLMGQNRELRTKAGPEAPFALTLWSDGKLSLSDTATGDTLELAAYGPTNAKTFAQLLPTAGKTQ